tara:strand:- start:256 stop:594 length:339 start_codon:yes stop_codon:yes gene_type:complete
MKISRMTRGDWGKTRAYFDLELVQGCTIKGCKLIEGDGFFVGMPSKLSKDENGQDKWKDIVYLDQNLKQKVTQIAMAEYESDLQPSNDMMPNTSQNERELDKENGFSQYIPE